MIAAPPSASARGYLSRTLPSVYVEAERPSFAIAPGGEPPEPFVVRWLGALEEILDPAVTLIDNLAWHFDAETAPDDIVTALLCWLGLEVAADLEPDARRRVLRRAMALGRRRGTLLGLRELLGLAFAGAQIEVTQTARATHGADPGERPRAPAPRVTVRCRDALAAQQRASLRRLVDDWCPAHVGWTLEMGERGTAA